MSADELRDMIWAYLYEADEARTLDDIAAFAEQDREAVRSVVHHEWFDVVNDRASIAYTASTGRIALAD